MSITFALKYRTLKYVYFFIFFAFVVLTSCDDNVIYDQNQNINAPWKYGQKVDFDYSISDTTTSYDLTIIIEHSPSFKYENLYLNTTTVFPDGKITTYPVTFQLTDEKGDWSGSCGGNHCHAELQMAAGAYYKTPGAYKISFEQYSREEAINGIQAIRIKIEKSKP